MLGSKRGIYNVNLLRLKSAKKVEKMKVTKNDLKLQMKLKKERPLLFPKIEVSSSKEKGVFEEPKQNG